MELFISYRRKSWTFTERLAKDLGKLIKGDIFVDYSGIDQTDFERSILGHLRTSDAVLLVVSEHTFAPDRIIRDDDWVRREIALALELDKPIALACVDALFPPSPAMLPKNIRGITQKQGIPFYPGYWDQAVQRLAEFLAKATPVRLVAPESREVSRQIASDETWNEAVSLVKTKQYDKAVFLLTELRDAGFKSKFINLETILQEATRHRDADTMGREYRIIASLARSSVMWEHAKAAWAKFQEQYPDFDQDIENLAERLRSRANESGRVAGHGAVEVKILETDLNRGSTRRDFWAGLLNKGRGKTNLFSRVSPGDDNWISTGAGVSGLGYTYVIYRDWGGVELYIDIGNQEKNKAIFDGLYSQKDIIEAEFGKPLDWQRLDTKRACRIRKNINEHGGLAARDKWPALQDAMIEAMIAFEKVLRPRISRNRLEEYYRG